MRVVFAACLVAVLLASCGGVPSASPSPSSSPPVVQASTSPAPSSRNPVPVAAHTLGIFEVLRIFNTTNGEMDLTNLLKGEVQYLGANVNDELMAMPAFKAYVEAVNALSDAYKLGADVESEVAAVLATEAALAEIAGVTATPSPAAVATPNIHGAAELEELMPADFRGSLIYRISIGPSGWDSADPAVAELVQVIAESLGGDINDLSMATGTTGRVPAILNIMALKMDGITGAKLLESFTKVVHGAQIGSTLEDMTIDGRKVEHVISPATPRGGLYLFTAGDVLLVVQADEAAVATELISTFP